ncbi:MAG TPA: hypothetical protein PLI18_14410 [Pirellulaceae bacterium]|nr:hypothetical protein [Pirellulaceae bacterium]
MPLPARGSSGELPEPGTPELGSPELGSPELGVEAPGEPIRGAAGENPERLGSPPADDPPDGSPGEVGLPCGAPCGAPIRELPPLAAGSVGAKGRSGAAEELLSVEPLRKAPVGGAAGMPAEPVGGAEGPAPRRDERPVGGGVGEPD